MPSPHPTDAPRRLLDQVHDAISARHYSRRTGRAYADWIRRFVLYHGKRHQQAAEKPALDLASDRVMP